MTESTTINDYNVEYDRFGKPTFTDKQGRLVSYKDLKGNTLGLANDYYRLASGKSQDGKEELNLSKEKLKKDTQQLVSSDIKTASPEAMDKINAFLDSLDNANQEKINGLKTKLSTLKTKTANAVKKPISKINQIFANKQKSGR